MLSSSPRISSPSTRTSSRSWRCGLLKENRIGPASKLSRLFPPMALAVVKACRGFDPGGAASFNDSLTLACTSTVRCFLKASSPPKNISMRAWRADCGASVFCWEVPAQLSIPATTVARTNVLRNIVRLLDWSFEKSISPESYESVKIEHHDNGED